MQGGNKQAIDFLEWIDKYFPDIARMVEPLGIENATWLVERYEIGFLRQIISAMHNNDVSGRLGIRSHEKIKASAISTIRAYIASNKVKWDNTNSK